MAATNHQFRLTLPTGWEDNSIFTFMGPDSHGVRHILNLVIEKNVGDHTVESFARERIQLAQSGLGTADTLKDAPRKLSNGQAAYEWIYKTVPIDGKAIFHQQVYTVINKRGYTFSAVYSKMSFKLLAGQVEQIISSFLPLE
jgi:hypothetical protein